MKKIYIELVEHLGDIVACEPISKYLRKKNKDAHIAWIIHKNYKDVIVNNPYINEIITVESLSEADSLCQKYENEGCEIINLHYKGRLCSKTGEIHANNINSRINERNIFNNFRSIVESFSEIAGLEKISDAPKFHLADNIEIKENLPKEYVVFHCKSNMKEKDWHIKKWNQLASKLLKEGYKIVEIGKEPVISTNNKNYYDLTSLRDIQQIAKIIKGAKCFLGIDSAFAHIANCFNIYAILIFGKYTHFTEYNPYSGNYGKYQNCTFIYTKVCSEKIPTSKVYSEFKSFINNETDKMNRRTCGKWALPFIFKDVLNSIFTLKNEINEDGNKYKILVLLGIKFKTRYKQKKIKITNQKKAEFIDYILNNQLDKSEFVPLSEEKYELKPNNTKLISFYLPQFHSFPSNDDWFGRGFTEWTNVTKTCPQYTGHMQPHLPIDVGYYNLETTSIMKRQIELAKQYGIYGFSFYYYWYSGKKIMEKPIQNFLKDKSLDMPFFMFWANENWSHLWGNGADEEILYKQEILEGDAEKFMEDILPYMKDERYIKINNKPLLIIYNPEIYPYSVFIEFVDRIRQIAKENGFDDLMINTILKPFMKIGVYKEYLEKYHLDAIVEFLPGCVYKLFRTKNKPIMNPLFKGRILDVEDFVKYKKYSYDSDATLFKGVFPIWDNTARRCYKGAAIFESNPSIYKKWLKGAMQWTKANNTDYHQFVFINAWNEWAEGAHLEPDAHFGYAFLQATKEALEEENK